MCTFKEGLCLFIPHFVVHQTNQIFKRCLLLDLDDLNLQQILDTTPISKYLFHFKFLFKLIVMKEIL